MSIFDFLDEIDDVEPTPILVAPHPVLRQKAREVLEEDMETIRAALPGMFSAMYKAPGIGLAAPQVGLSLRFIIIDLSDRKTDDVSKDASSEDSDDKSDDKSGAESAAIANVPPKRKREKSDAVGPLVLINPEIVELSERVAPRQEGCLSLPNQFADVTRPEVVKVRYRDLDGKIVEREETGLLGTCIQHEMDHLDGLLFVDHLTTLKRNMVMRRLSKEQKRRR